MSRGDWRGRRVLVTGVTGFKGSWLALWLRELGATVVGYSLPPPTSPSLFQLARVGDAVEWIDADVREAARVRRAVAAASPDVVFHLAAQPLVRASYESPVATFETNVLGTVNLLDALRESKSVRAIVVVTSDKCYENREWCWPYREEDHLGGYDPYSSSKACAEIATAAYRRSFFEGKDVGIATARAGNVIGGGDWARDRIVPDIVSALRAREAVLVRNPASVRPWQHVLEPLHGYLAIAEGLLANPRSFGEGWNFGPDADSIRTVSDLVSAICARWGDGATWRAAEGKHPHEARLLMLDSSKARTKLGWRPRLRFDEAIASTVDWYKAFLAGEDMEQRTVGQIRQYEEAPQ